MVIYHYFKDWKRLSSLLFILIAVVDIGSACSAIARVAMILLFVIVNNLYWTFEHWMYWTIIMFGNLCLVTSTFLGMVLTVVKTINTINPFYRIDGCALKVCLLFFVCLGLVLFVVDFSCDVTFSDTLPCFLQVELFLSTLIVLLPGNCTLTKLAAFLTEHHIVSQEIAARFYKIAPIFIDFCLPCLIVLVCMILQIVYIRRAFSQSSDPRQNIANHATITVFMISLLYLSSISAYFSLMFIFSIEDVVKLVTRFTLPLMTAALFPTILILRKAELRATYRGYISTVLRLPVTVFYNIRHRVSGYRAI